MKKLLYLLSAAVLVLSSCNKDDVIEVDSKTPPRITLDSDNAVYTIKSGRELLISPTYDNADKALYVWTISGKVVGTEPAFAFRAQTAGEVFVTLAVSNRHGSTSEELRVDVVELEIPTISLPVPDTGYTLLANSPLALSPSVTATSIPTTYTWSVNGKEVTAEKNFTFKEAQTGKYTLRFATRNEDGEDNKEFKVKVCTLDEMPFVWTFDQTQFNLSSGRRIRLMPMNVTNAFDAVYTWSVNGKQVQQSADPVYIFAESAEGTYTVNVEMKNAYTTVPKELTVNVCPAEGRYYRSGAASSSENWKKVYEFLSAPGQFVNEGYTATTMAEACTYAESQLKKETHLSLGAFGGYLVVGFDHSIDNDGDYNIAVRGNPFKGSSEPGIVWVMQDENGDGLPNDTWYELKGSEHGKPETAQDYAVTYYRPRAAGMDVLWTDNRGNSGSVDYLSSFHRQDSYYPAWVTTESYTLRGTCLAARSHDQSGNGSYWVNEDYDWGYADNFSPADLLGKNANHFKISNAVTFDGKPANLTYIDFVKVQGGIQAKSGWLGEISTEVLGIYDYNMTKKK